MSRCIALVGFSDWTLPYLKDSKADEIWTMNHHLFIDELEDPSRRNLPRVDRLFETHRKDWFLRKEIPKNQEYWAWLQQRKPFPIYMIEQFPEVPSCVLYPREALFNDLFKGLLFRGESEQEYYTSSFALMAALAIHEKVDRIEIYGIEMATGTEYEDQKPGGEFWIGYAMGRGIRVDLHPRSHLCNAVVYGYDAVPHITQKRIDELIEHYQQKNQEAMELSQQAREAFNSGKTKDHTEAMEASAWNAMYLGAVTMLKLLREHFGTYVSAQHLEEHENEKMLREEKYKADTNTLRAEVNILIGDGRQEAAAARWQAYLTARANMYANSGARQVVRLLRQECRLRQPTHELQMLITS